MSVPDRIQRLLDGGQLQDVEASDADVAALWQKAVTSARDAANPSNSADNQYVWQIRIVRQGPGFIGRRRRGAAAVRIVRPRFPETLSEAGAGYGHVSPHAAPRGSSPEHQSRSPDSATGCQVRLFTVPLRRPDPGQLGRGAGMFERSSDARSCGAVK